jgi:hypothetical protein
LWEKQREIIEWAKINVKKNMTVFYHSTDNILAVLMLSKLIGPYGKLTIVGYHN